MEAAAAGRGGGRKGRRRDKAQRAAAGGGGAASKKPVDGMLWGSDLGSQVAIDRGLVDYAKDAVVPLVPGDPHGGTRTQPRAQRVWAPERLSRGRNPAIGPESLQAAERFMHEWLWAEFGARAGTDNLGIRIDPWARLPYSERRAMCRQSVAMAATRLGPRAMGVVRWCVLQVTPAPDVLPTVDEWARAQRPNAWGIERAVGFLAAALETLAVHYGYAKASPATIAPGRREGDGS